MTYSDGNWFRLAFWKTWDLEYWHSKNITTNYTTAEFADAIGDYYKNGNVCGCTPRVVKTRCTSWNDIDVDCATTPAEEIRDHVYKIVVPRSISQPSATDIVPVPIDTLSVITVNLPDSGVRPAKLSQAPL